MTSNMSMDGGCTIDSYTLVLLHHMLLSFALLIKYFLFQDFIVSGVKASNNILKFLSSFSSNLF